MIRIYTAITRYGFILSDSLSSFYSEHAIVVELYDKYLQNKGYFLFHTILGFIYCALIVIQINPFRKPVNLFLHKVRGIIILLSVHLITASGIFLSSHSSMFKDSMSFMCQVWLILLFFTFKGMFELKKKDFKKHSEWMRRLVMLSMGPSTQTVVMMIVSLLSVSSETVKLVRGLSGYLGYYGFLVVLEFLLFLERRVFSRERLEVSKAS